MCFQDETNCDGICGADSQLDFIQEGQCPKWLFMGAPPKTREFLTVASKTLTLRNVLTVLTSLNANRRRKCGQSTSHTPATRALRPRSLPCFVVFVVWKARNISCLVCRVHYEGWIRFRSDRLGLIIRHSKPIASSHRATHLVLSSYHCPDWQGKNSHSAICVGAPRRSHRRRWLVVCDTKRLAGWVMCQLAPSG